MDQVFLALVTHFVTKANINNRNAGLVVMGQDSQSQGRGFISLPCILDGHFSHC